MELVEHIFHLCIVYILFNMIWGLLVQLPKLLITGLSSNSTLDHSVKAIRYLLLSTLTYSSTLLFMENHPTLNPISLYIISGLILSIYLAGKLNKKPSIFKFASSITTNLNFGKKKPAKEKLNYEKHIVGLSIVTFASCVGIPFLGGNLGENPLNIWFLDTIKEIYETPILEWLIGFAGIVFMLSMLQKGVVTIQELALKISGKKSPKKEDNPLDKIMNEFKKMKSNSNPFDKGEEKVELDDELYVDFEEMNEEEEENK